MEFDYLRLGMGYLELPLWDGSVIEAENAVFEDRGGGNFLWTGEVPGAGYESVLFTVQDHCCPTNFRVERVEFACCSGRVVRSEVRRGPAAIFGRTG